MLSKIYHKTVLFSTAYIYVKMWYTLKNESGEKHMQIDRLFGILNLLINNKIMTASSLAEHFEVSRRTILRDINSLSLAGIPIYTQKGRGGGISLLENYVLSKALLSKEEQQQIVTAMGSVSLNGLTEDKNVLEKLKALFGVKEDGGWIEVDFSRWGVSAGDKEKFRILKESVLGKKTVLFEYFSAYSALVRQRKVYPLKIVYKAKAWYLQAYAENGYRTFKVNRIKNLQATDESFEHMHFEAPPIEYAGENLPVYQQIILKFKSEMLYRIYDEFAEENIVKNSDGTVTVSLNIPIDNWIVGYILSFGASVQVLNPQILTEYVKKQAELIIDIYK